MNEPEEAIGHCEWCEAPIFEGDEYHGPSPEDYIILCFECTEG